MDIVEEDCWAGWTTGLTQSVISYVLRFFTGEGMPHANHHLHLLAAGRCASVFPFLGRINSYCWELLQG